MRRVLAPAAVKAVLFLLFVGVLLGYTALGPGRDPATGAGPPAPRATIAIQRWVDADTVVVTGTMVLGDVDAEDGKRDVETVRLIGVDTPESVGRYKGNPQCYGPEATTFSKSLLPVGSSAVLEFDNGTTTAQMRDRTPSHRLLAYLWTHDRTMVNLALVREGYARALGINPQNDYRTLFKTAAATAKLRGKGLWSACARTS